MPMCKRCGTRKLMNSVFFSGKSRNLWELIFGEDFGFFWGGSLSTPKKKNGDWIKKKVNITRICD